jgi:hypothetical protein
MDKKLVKYIQDNLHKGYSHADVAERLREEGWEDEDIQTALADAAKSHIERSRLALALVGLAAFIVLGLIVYFFVISPSFVQTPEIEKPVLLTEQVTQQAGGMQSGTPELASQTEAFVYPQQEAITSETSPAEEPVAEPVQQAPETVQKAPQQQPAVSMSQIDSTHIAYVLTALGAYKLHANPFSGALPELEIIITDIGKTFDAVVQDNKVVVKEGSSKSPDVTISVDQDAVVQLLAAETPDQLSVTATKLFNERNQRGYKGELLAAQTDLLLKGYLGLYNDAKKLASPTGSVVSDVELVGSQLTGMFLMIVILWAALILRMALSRGK